MTHVKAATGAVTLCGFPTEGKRTIETTEGSLATCRTCRDTALRGTYSSRRGYTYSNLKKRGRK